MGTQNTVEMTMAAAYYTEPLIQKRVDYLNDRLEKLQDNQQIRRQRYEVEVIHLTGVLEDIERKRKAQVVRIKAALAKTGTE